MSGGLSPFNNRSDKTTELLREFLLLVSDFGQLLNRPDEMAKQIKSAIQLSEFEQKKVNDAVAFITEAKTRRDELQKIDKSVSEKHKEVQQMLEDQKNLERINKETQSKLAEISKKHAEKEKLHAEKEDFLAKEEKRIHELNNTLNEKGVELGKKQQMLNDLDNRTKEHAERLRRAAEGL